MFEIDTGTRTHAPQIDRVEGIMFAVLDGLPEGATQAQIDDAIIQQVFGSLREPKRSDTVRRRLLQLWPLIAPLAEREPAQFDAILLEYLDRIDATG
jgi:hypothetical protein